MKHYGDIKAMSGYEIPPVDVITGGSPCQDLSVAGLRKGLAGERSGLFMEQVRIVKEMRERDRAAGRAGVLVRPRYMVWENVDGARSSPGGAHKGEDFAAVLEEIVKAAAPGCDVRVPVPDGGWPRAGCYYADDGSWSLAWRLVDAQYWGTPQRRRRICLLADFNGLTAPEILFDPQLRRTAEDGEPIEITSGAGESGASEVPPESESLRGDHRQSGAPGQEAAAGITGGAGESGEPVTLKVRGGRDVDSAGKRAGKGALVQRDMSATIGVSQDQTLIQPCLNPWDVQSKHIQPPDGIAEALYSGECRYGGGESYVAAVDVYNQSIEGETSPTVTAAVGGSNTSGPKIMAAGFSFGQSAKARTLGYEEERSPTLRGGEGGNQKPVVLAVDCRNATESDVNAALQANAAHSLNGNNVVRTEAYGICSLDSNSMKSANPNSGFYEADTSRTLDNNGGNPSCNQGGIAVVSTIPLEGNGARPSHFGAGHGQNGDPSFTLNHVEQHGVAICDAAQPGGVLMMGLTNRGYDSGDKAETLRAQSHGAIPMVATDGIGDAHLR